MTKPVTRLERAALDGVAQCFSAAWQKGGLVKSGRRIAVDVVAAGRKPAGQAQPRLRFDKVVLRLMADLRAALWDLPESEAVIVTVTAPIWQPGKTAVAIIDKVRAGLGRRDVHAMLFGNHVRLRRVTGVPAAMPKVIGFVHNADTDPAVLFDVAQTIMRQLGKHKALRPGGRWLVLADEGFPQAATYEHVWDQIATPAGYDKVLVALAKGEVRVLHG